MGKRLLNDTISYNPKSLRKENEINGFLFILKNKEIVFLKAVSTELACKIIEEKYPDQDYFLESWISYDCENIKLTVIE